MKTSPIKEESPNSMSPFSFTKAFQFKKPDDSASPRISAFNNWSPCGTQPNYDKWTSPFIDWKCLSGLSPLLTTPLQIKTTQKTNPSNLTIEKGAISQFDCKISPNEEETDDSITLSKKPKEQEGLQKHESVEQTLPEEEVRASERVEEEPSAQEKQMKKEEIISGLREIKVLQRSSKAKKKEPLKKKEVKKKIKPNPVIIEENQPAEQPVPSSSSESIKLKEITNFEGLILDLNYDFESEIEDVDFETGYLLCRAEEEKVYEDPNVLEDLHLAIFPYLQSLLHPETSGTNIEETLSTKKKKAFAYECATCGKKYAKSSSLGGHVAKAHQGFNLNATLKKEQRDKRALDRDRNKFLREQCLQQLNTRSTV